MCVCSFVCACSLALYPYFSEYEHARAKVGEERE